MIHPVLITIIILLYLGALVSVALWMERRRGSSWLIKNPWFYSLSLGVYCTTWTFYGSVGKAVNSGVVFFAIYLGPTLGFLLGWKIMRLMCRLKSAHRITSIADFISVRYDKSMSLSALATVAAVVGTLPYIAIQLKAVISSFEIIAAPSMGFFATMSGPFTVAAMILFTILFGVRRMDPTERHPGVVAAIALESLVKLVAFLAVGVYVVFFMHDGVGDILEHAQQVGFNMFSGVGETAPSGATWLTYTVLAMCAAFVLPRQFHVAVVENSNEEHIRSARWQFPLYLLLINLFVVPIAIAGLDLGLPVEQADSFVLLLPQKAGNMWLTLLVFIGGFSAATGMIIISAMTLSTMVTNHLLVPITQSAPSLDFLQRYILETRWVVVAGVILGGYWFQASLGQSYILVSIGLISFAAALQFVPALLGGLFWTKGDKLGALLGVGAGFAVWFYTLMAPIILKSGVLPEWVGHTGPWALSWLNPEQLFNIAFPDNITHSVFWSMLANVGGYVLGSLLVYKESDEGNLAREFAAADAGIKTLLTSQAVEAVIPLDEKIPLVERIFTHYFPKEQARDMALECRQDAELMDSTHITVFDLAGLQTEVENKLSGSIGSAAARRAVGKSNLFTQQETHELSSAYAGLLAKLKLPPEELTRRIDYYQERAELLESHAGELELRIAEREKEILERKLAVEALQQAERKYRSFFENALEGIFQSTPSGRFISTNPTMASVLGYDSPEDLMDSVTDIANQLYTRPEERLMVLDKIYEQGLIKAYETQFYCKDGGKRWFSLSARPVLDENGFVLYLEGSIIDITEHKHNEALLQQKLAAEASNKAKSDFLAKMSHEIRTPMNAMLGMAELLKESPLSREQQNFVNIFMESGETLMQLLNDILDVSKVEAGLLELERAPFHLRDLVESTCQTMAPRAHKKGLQIACRLAPDVPTHLIGDPTRLKQILFNLLGNAIKFTTVGEVVLHVERVADMLEPNNLLFLVWDTGIGIPPEQYETIFDSFTQADSSTTRNYGGSGLGLAISKRLVELMGGKIWVSSRSDKGSVFFFTANFTLQNTPAEDPLKELAPLKNLRVLIQGGNPTLLQGVEQDLTDWGARTTLAETPNEFLNELTAAPEDKSFDLALIDCFNPPDSELALVKRVRDTAPNLPVALLITPEMRDARQEGERLGIETFIYKPATRNDLAQSLIAAIGAEPPPVLERISGALPEELPDKPTSILLAEDSENNRILIKYFLKNQPYNLDEAENGKIAVEKFMSENYDIVFMDMEMPIMDGFTATRHIRTYEAEQGLSPTPIVALTAHAFAEIQEKCMDSGCTEFLAKPVKKKVLLETLSLLTAPRLGDAPETPAPQTPAPGASASETTPAFANNQERNVVEVEKELEVLIPRFMELTKKDLVAMYKNLETGNHAELARLGHSLKGAGKGYGFSYLSELGKSIEVAAKAQDFAAAGAALHELADYMAHLHVKYV